MASIVRWFHCGRVIMTAIFTTINPLGAELGLPAIFVRMMTLQLLMKDRIKQRI